MTTQQNPEGVDVEKLTASAKFVLYALEDVGPATPVDLAEETQLPARTVRYALRQLRDAGVVERTPDPTDGRRRLYAIDGE